MKARDFRRAPENGGRCSAEDCDKCVGVPWEPCPEANGGYQLMSKVRLPAGPSEIPKTVKGKDEFIRRRFRFKKEDFEVRVHSRMPRM